MGRLALRPEPRARPSINVTPLVDVVLVLLIIFMVVTPEMANQDRIELPSIMFPDPDAKASTPPLEIVLSNDRLTVDDEPIRWEVLDERLAAVRIADPRRRVVVRADVNVPYGEVRRLYQACERHHFPGVAVAVSERPKKEIPPALAHNDG